MMENLKSKVSQFLRDEEGLELSEYAVAGSLIVIGTVVAFGALSGAIGEAIDDITTVITTGAAPA
ncbi:Flp family type IVb pilin [Marinobacter sp. M216]|uniref:Flp family type IVb pilin n=1 Tax=Marinobacter albus TaxID=3030833 RepID=A0ABT7HC98_9GAMM|nr:MULTISPECIES: Flp family type IVb pilin [unclassified Marinobacter]MBW7469742.1 Flp family type IVb pilin [Marinobacter sp. F4218]MDK9557999.1 Flp family type IVb pilin [Marinobacter sp. M216]